MNCPYTLRDDVAPHLNGNRYQVATVPEVMLLMLILKVTVSHLSY
ncbi:hypothetical protein [Nostoc sp. KVJ3]|nr:hypothetical protein [Nostoc sp. KVJ3]